MQLNFLDPSILENLKKSIDEHSDYLINKYSNFNGKKKISAIFSSKDWLHIVVNVMPTIDLYNNNDDIKSMNVMQFISMIDLISEAIQQLHRVLFNGENYPFHKDRTVFNKEISDDQYFSHIRAAFGAHPVNLNSADGKKSNNKYYASWSSNHGSADFSVYLYSNNPNEGDRELAIQFKELMSYAKKRYVYIKEICNEIKKQEQDHNEKLAKKPIIKDKEQLKQLEILQVENNNRFGRYGYTYEIEQLLELYKAPKHFPKDLDMYHSYLSKLDPVITEIYTNLQTMEIKELSLDPVPRYYSQNKLDKFKYHIGKLQEYFIDPSSGYSTASFNLECLIDGGVIPAYANIEMDKRDLMLLLYSWLEFHGASLHRQIYSTEENKKNVVIIDDISLPNIVIYRSYE